jgi:hypothetical protein
MLSGETCGTFASERNHPFVNTVILSKTPFLWGSVKMRLNLGGERFLGGERVADGLQQLVVIDRFLKESDGASQGCALPDSGIVTARDDHNGNLFRGIQPAKPFHDTEPVPRYAHDFRWKCEIQQDKIGMLFADHRYRLRAIHGGQDLEAGPLQFQGDCLDNDLVIINNQNDFSGCAGRINAHI